MIRVAFLVLFVISLQALPGCDAFFRRPGKNNNNNNNNRIDINNKSNDEEAYAILIDAGSTGSKMYVYKISLNKWGKVDEVSDLEQLENPLGKVKPGLSSLLDKQDEIALYLEKFIDTAKEIVPEDKWTSTPILVLATAGMRLLPEADQDVIMDKVREALSNEDFSPFLYNEQNVRVISGKDEAIYAWITVNFIQGVLTAPGRRQRTWGTLDLGGASTQNTFFYKMGETRKVGKRFYRLFAKSYLDMGLQSIHERFLELLVNWDDKTEDDEGNIKSPCHHNGFKETFDVGDQKVGVVGEPNSEVCRELVDAMVFCTKKTPNQECPFNDQPKLTGKLLAFSAFHTVIDRIGALICEDKPVTIEQIGCAANKYCSKPYHVVKPADEGYTKFSCLWGHYVHELLSNGYRMPQNREIYVKKELKGYSLSWIIGAVLDKTELL